MVQDLNRNPGLGFQPSWAFVLWLMGRLWFFYRITIVYTHDWTLSQFPRRRRLQLFHDPPTPTTFFHFSVLAPGIVAMAYPFKPLLSPPCAHTCNCASSCDKLWQLWRCLRLLFAQKYKFTAATGKNAIVEGSTNERYLLNFVRGEEIYLWLSYYIENIDWQ